MISIYNDKLTFTQKTATYKLVFGQREETFSPGRPFCGFSSITFQLTSLSPYARTQRLRPDWLQGQLPLSLAGHGRPKAVHRTLDVPYIRLIINDLNNNVHTMINFVSMFPVTGSFLTTLKPFISFRFFRKVPTARHYFNYTHTSCCVKLSLPKGVLFSSQKWQINGTSPYLVVL